MNNSDNHSGNKTNYKVYQNEKFEYQDENSSSDTILNLEYRSNKNTTITNEFKENVVSVYDVASYILSKIDGNVCTTMKLHKLLYYCQSWSMVWCEKPTFTQKIEAWANGPVIRDFFYFHKGFYSIHYNDLSLGNENLLSQEQKNVIDDVLEFYGDKKPQWLIELTHSEDPWITARKGLLPNESGNKEITLESMQQYYSSL